MTYELALLAYWSFSQKLNRVSSVQLHCSALAVSGSEWYHRWIKKQLILQQAGLALPWLCNRNGIGYGWCIYSSDLGIFCFVVFVSDLSPILYLWLTRFKPVFTTCTNLSCFLFSSALAGIWQTLLLAASVFCISLQSDIVFACDVTGHLLALTSCCCFAQHLAFHCVWQQWVMLQDVPHACKFALSYCVQSVHLFSWTLCNTSSFIAISAQLIFSILLQTHISNTNRLSLSACVLVHVSAAVLIQYTKTLWMFTEY